MRRLAFFGTPGAGIRLAPSAFRPTLVALAIILSASLGTALIAGAQTVQITTNVAVNSTWGPTGTVVGTVFWVRNSIAVNSGVRLDIQPGVVVKFDPGRNLTINGTLKAIGLAPSNIFFTSIKDDAVGGDTNGDGNATVPAASDWAGITFPDASPDNSRFDYCDIRYAGSGSTGALTFISATDSVTNCVIRRAYYGVDCQGSAAPALANTSIEASTQTPIVLDFTAAPVLSSLVFSSSNNGYDAFGLRGGTLLNGTSATLPQRGATVGVNPVSNVTYVLFGSLTINVGASLTINPGVVIKPIGGQSITVSGNLTMNGTAAAGDTITITSIHDDNFGLPSDTNNNGSITAPNRGDWNRIVFNQGSTGSVQRCRLKFGSNNTTQGVVEMANNSIGVSNCLLSDIGHGLAMFGVSNPAVTNVAINNCSSTPILMSVSANPVFTNISFLANAITALGLNGETIAVDSHIFFRNVAGYTNITYYLMNGVVQMSSPAILTIDPGVVIKNELNGGGFIIDGGLVADGTPAQPIVFTSVRDDLYGNPPDTNGDGSTTTPAQGNWSYIRFTGTSNDLVSKLDNCRVTYASYGPFDGYATAIWITSAAAPITNCFITKAAYGIRVDGNGTPLIDNCDINNCSSAPIVMSVLADPTISTNNIYSTNTYNAIALISETLSQDARIKYRPGVGTPTFAYLPTGTITVGTGVTLSIDPQVVLKPTSSFNLFSVNGALNVVGSNGTTGRVIITSRRDDNPIYGGDTTPTDASTPQAGDWGSIVYNDQSIDGSCVLRNVLFQFGGAGGNDGGTIVTNSASPRLVRLEFFQNYTVMTFTGNSAPTVDSTNILNCIQIPIVFSLVSDPQFPHPDLITMANNTYTALGLLGETIAQNVHTGVRRISGISNIAYCPTGTITIAFGAKWTIDPGIVIKLGRVSSDPIGVLVSIDGALRAVGKPDSLIVFTSSADDAFGGDIKGDGALTLPTTGNWYGIRFSAVSNDTASFLTHCRIRYAGYASDGALKFTNAGPSITNCYITSTSAYGVQVEGNSTPIFTNCQIDSSTNVPVNMSLVSEPVFNNVQFLGNTYTALGVIGESIAQDVLWKIRAVAGRNNMPYLLQGQLTTGLGATVVMQPGVIVKSNGSGSIFIQRAFQAEGRSVQPESLVVFTSYRDDFYGGDTNNDGSASVPTAGEWNYITVDGTAIDPQVRFKNCVLRYGGSGTTLGVIRCVNSSPTVDSCLISVNSCGISVEGASNPRVHECSFFGNTQFAINNTGNSFCVDADSCWWGAASGPNDNSATADLCGLGLNAGTGDKASNNVDYTPFKVSGIVNALLGDVSLNGQVLAYDASLVMQSLVAIITLNSLQTQVADVDGDNIVTGLDASYILQWVAGIIKAFPAVNNGVQHVGPGEIAAAAPRRAETFSVQLGTARRVGDEWLVPVQASGSAAIFSVELRLEDGSASSLTGIEVAESASLYAHNVVDGVARVAMAAAMPLASGEVATLHFPAGEGEWTAPRLAWARVNATTLAPAQPPVSAPALSFLGMPSPNPAGSQVQVRLALARAQEGRASLRVLDVSGRVVRTVFEGALPAGEHPLFWDLRDRSGGRVGPGLYFLDVRAGAFHATRRLIVVR
jgi:hypothetical protein